MKSFDVKYDLGQEVYILTENQIHKREIEGIRIIQRSPYYIGFTDVRDSGIKIEYLIMTTQRNNCATYDYYKQEDVYLSKEDLFQKIV